MEENSGSSPAKIVVLLFLLSLWPAAYALSYFGMGCTNLETTNWPWDIVPWLFNVSWDYIVNLGVVNFVFALGLVILSSPIWAPLMALYLVVMPFLLIAQAVGINC